MAETSETLNPTAKTDLFKIDPRAIVVMDGWNSRCNFGDIDVLAEQIREQGMLNPVAVQPFTEDGVEKYHLIDGERRYRAVMKLIAEGVDIARIPAIKLSKSLTQEQLMIQQYQRNEEKNFTEYEKGLFVRKMMDACGKTVTEVARLIGANVGCLTYAVQLLEMDPRVQELVKAERISGANVRRIYQCHKDDEEGAVQEILGLLEKADEKGVDKEGNAAKISLKDLDVKGRTILSKDSKAIMKGLKLLFKYYDESGITTGFKPRPMLVELENGRLITDIFDELKESQLQKAE